MAWVVTKWLEVESWSACKCVQYITKYFHLDRLHIESSSRYCKSLLQGYRWYLYVSGHSEIGRGTGSKSFGLTGGHIIMFRSREGTQHFVSIFMRSSGEDPCARKCGQR